MIQGSVAPRSSVRVSSLPGSFPRSWFSRKTPPSFALHFTLLAIGLLLPAAAIQAQTAAAASSKAATRSELRVSTIEAGTRTRSTFTIKVAPQEDEKTGSTVIPTGTVTFVDGDRSIGSAFLDSEGNASLTVDALPSGLQHVTATYEGDAAHQASVSAQAVVNSATSGVPAFTLTAAPTSLKVPVGTAGATVITATPENGFNKAIALSCAGVPYATISCTFSPATVTPTATGKAVASTLTLQTLAVSGALRPGPGQPRGSETAYAILVPGFLALVGLGLARKRAFRAARLSGLVILLLASGIGLGACSQRYSYYHHAPVDNAGTPLGNYTVVISGTTGTGSTLTTGSVQVALAVTAD
jgi:Tfp pilus assembly protein PilE